MFINKYIEAGVWIKTCKLILDSKFIFRDVEILLKKLKKDFGY